jgi:hypothetical protein
MAKIIITLDGGLVQGVFLLKNDLYPGKIDGAVIVDWDTDEAEDSDVTEARDSSGGLIEALVHGDSIDPITPDSDLSLVTMAFLEPGLVAKTDDKDLPLLLPRLTTEAGKQALTEKLRKE